MTPEESQIDTKIDRIVDVYLALKKEKEPTPEEDKKRKKEFELFKNKLFVDSPWIKEGTKRKSDGVFVHFAPDPRAHSSTSNAGAITKTRSQKTHNKCKQSLRRYATNYTLSLGYNTPDRFLVPRKSTAVLAHRANKNSYRNRIGFSNHTVSIYDFF